MWNAATKQVTYRGLSLILKDLVINAEFIICMQTMLVIILLYQREGTTRSGGKPDTAGITVHTVLNIRAIVALTCISSAINVHALEFQTNTEIAKEVIAGKWGSGETRKKKLKAAGYDYNAVQKIVNKLCKK